MQRAWGRGKCINQLHSKIRRNRPVARNICKWLKIECEGTKCIHVVQGRVKDWNSANELISLFAERLPAVQWLWSMELVGVRCESAEFEGCSLVLYLIVLQKVSLTIYFILCFFVPYIVIQLRNVNPQMHTFQINFK